MIYLITQLAGWLLLAAAFAAMSGWVYAAVQARPAEIALQRERENLVRDLGALATRDGAGEADDGELDTLRSRVDVEAARAAEAERALQIARSRAEELTGQLTALQRAIEQRDEHEAAALQQALVEVEATPVTDEAVALQAWRLRYFEARVRYLEGSRPAAAPAPPSVNDAPLEWRARVAEARAAHLEEELRDAERTPQHVQTSTEPEVAAFAANAETDALLRWRMLYLEKRVAHLQERAAPAQASEVAPLHESGPDPETWKWRARYLEARLRHLETKQTPASVQPAANLTVSELAPLVPAGSELRPDTLPGARGGAPDDLTLIEGVTLLQQTTLYSLGIFHFDQIAAWSPANVAWVDQYFRLRGRIVEEEWVEQANELAREGPAAARRGLESEPA